VDGLILEERPEAAPRVAFLELGGGALARRLHPRLVPLVQGLARTIGLTDGEPLRIPWSKVTRVHVTIEVDIDAEQTAAYAWERWLREGPLRGIPSGPLKK
jgi:hypothetical protein